MAKKTVLENEKVTSQVEGTENEKGEVEVEGNKIELEVGAGDTVEVDSTEDIKDDSGNTVMKDVSDRKSSIKKAKMPMTIRNILKEKAVIRFDLAEQRNTVWKEEQKSLFIHTLIYGYPFPTAFAVSTNDGFIWMLDGKQRTTTVLSFVQDGFKLHKDTPDCFGVEIAGKKFSQLPEDFQNEILDSSFDIWEMKNLSNQERAEMFYRLNNGSPLTKLEVTRSMYSEFFGEVAELAKLSFFTDVISLSNTAKNRFVDQELVVQIAMLLDEDYKLKGFGGNHIREYVLNLKENEGHFPQEMVQLYKSMSTYLEEAFDLYNKKEVAKALKKINVPMVFMQALEAKKIGMKPQQFGEFVKWFLIDIYNIESAYGVSCQAGSAKKENVMVRLKEMDKAFKKYIKKHPVDKYVPAVREEEGGDKPSDKPEDKPSDKPEEGKGANKPVRGGKSTGAGARGSKKNEEVTV